MERKKILFAGICITVLLSLCSCGKGKSSNEPAANEITAEADNSNDTADIGAIDGQKYIIEKANLELNIPENWTTYSKKELAVNYNVSEEEFTNEKLTERFVNSDGSDTKGDPLIYFAHNDDVSKPEMINIYLTYDLDTNSKITDENYEKKIKVMEEVYKETEGINDVNVIKTNFLGTECLAIEYSTDYDGKTMYDRFIFWGEGRFKYSISISSYDKAKIDQDMGYFKNFK